MDLQLGSYSINSPSGYGYTETDDCQCCCLGYLTANNYTSTTAKNFRKVLITILVLMIAMDSIFLTLPILFGIGPLAIPKLVFDIIPIITFIPNRKCVPEDKNTRHILAADLRIWRCALVGAAFTCIFSTIGFMSSLGVVNYYYYDVDVLTWVFFFMHVVASALYMGVICWGFKFSTRKMREKNSNITSLNQLSQKDIVVFNSVEYIPERILNIIINNTADTTLSVDPIEINRLSSALKNLTNRIEGLVKKKDRA